MQKLALEHKNKIIIWISHGYCTELIRERLGQHPFTYYNYGSVNRYEYEENKGEWNINEIDGKYH